MDEKRTVGNNAASLQQRLSDPLCQSYKRTLLLYIHSLETPSDRTIPLTFINFQHEPHIRLGYRRQLGNFSDCFWSLFYLHNESVNIWSHLLPAIGYLVALLKLDVETIHSGIRIQAMDKAVFQLYVVCTVGCLLLSAIYHCTNSHSEYISRCFLKLDYLGIVLNVMGTIISAAYFGLYGSPVLQGFYILFIVICTACAFYILLRNDIDGPDAVLQRYTILHLCFCISSG